MEEEEEEEEEEQEEEEEEEEEEEAARATVTPVPSAMLLAETQHHAAPRGQNKARRRREEESEMNNVMGRRLLTPTAASTVCFSMDDDGDVLAAQPTPLVVFRAGGSAAHRDAHRGHLAVRADPRCACTANGEPGGRTLEDRRAGACRAGYRRAQDFSGPDPGALCVSSSAEGGTVGGRFFPSLLFSS